MTLFTTAVRRRRLPPRVEAMYTWTRSRQTRLGGDIVPNQIIKVLQVDGVYDVAGTYAKRYCRRTNGRNARPLT
ncbi:hypothetical protein KCP78_21270 [Salmonella enterica subsp. enterica]|nr:hypothetical protein KCP78_21270 [Salmonella enterica subsp. enterica]